MRQDHTCERTPEIMVRVPHTDLEAYAAALIETTGAPPDTAKNVAESLVGADLTDHASHGVLRVSTYVDLAATGAIDPTAEPAIHADGPLVRVAGNKAFGQLVGRRTLDQAFDTAEAHGTATVGIGASAHLGRIGEWAERAAAEGFVFGAFTKSRSVRVTVPGATERVLSTNPVTWGVPTFDALPFPLVLDMATSQVAHGKISQRAATGDPLPEDWTVGPDGKPFPDAEAFEEGDGALLPLGGRSAGYKGYGLSVMTEVLAGVFGNAPVQGEHDQPPGLNDAAFFVVDPTRFTNRDQIRESVTALAERIRAVDRHPDLPIGDAARRDTLLLPGEAEYLIKREREESGIPLADAIARRLVALGEATGVADQAPPAFQNLH